MSDLKIVMLVRNHFVSSDWKDPRVYKEAQALLQAGHDVVVIGIGKEGLELPEKEVVDGIVVVRRPTIVNYLYNLWLRHFPAAGDRQHDDRRGLGVWGKFFRIVLNLRHNLNHVLFYAAVLPPAVRERADVYVGHDFDGLLAAYPAARLTGAHLVYDSHELWVERARGRPYFSWQKWWVTWQEKFVCQRCDLVIAVSQSVSQVLSKRYEIAAPLVIPNVHPYVEAKPSPSIRKKLNRGADSRVAIYVGFLNAGKGLEALIDAADYLEGITLAIVGDGESRQELEQRVREKRLERKVLFVGWVSPEELPTYVASADIGVSPLQSEWLNYYYNVDNKFFLYVMGGIPLAVSDQPEKRRLVEQFGIGTTFDETDPKDIARAIRQLLADPAAYEAMRGRCRRAAREALNWEIVAQDYVSAMERLHVG